MSIIGIDYAASGETASHLGPVVCHPVSPFLVVVVPTISELSPAPGEKQAVLH